MSTSANKFEKLGNFLVRRKRFALAGSLLFVILSGVIGGQVFARFDSGGYSNSKGDAIKVSEFLQKDLGRKQPAVAVILHSSGSSVDNPNFAQSAAKLERQIKSEIDVEKTLSYWSAGNLNSLKSKDGKSAYIFVYLKIGRPHV